MSGNKEKELGLLYQALDRVDGFIVNIDDRLVKHPAIDMSGCSELLDSALTSLLKCHTKLSVAIDKIEKPKGKK